MGGWQCSCLCLCLCAILLLPHSDAASVKLVHTGTETFEKDGVKHERSRYRLVPNHENHEPVDKAAIKILPNDEHNTNLTVDQYAKTVAIKVLSNEEHNDELKVDKHAKNVAIKVLPNEEHNDELKVDKHAKKVAIKVLPNEEHNDELKVDKHAKKVEIKVLPNEEHNDELKVDKHAKKVAVKVLPNDGYKHSLKTDEFTEKVTLTILPNDAQNKFKAAIEKNKTGNFTYHYSTKTLPKSGATHKTTYHYSTKTLPNSATHKTESKVIKWSSGRMMNSSAQNLWNEDPSKDLYSYTTRGHGDNQDHKLSNNNKLREEFLEQFNTQGHHETTEDHVRREGSHDDLQWRLIIRALLRELLSKMRTIKGHSEATLDLDSKKKAVSASVLLRKAAQEHSNDVLMAPQELGNHDLAYNEIIQQNLTSLNTQGEHENRGNEHEKLQKNLLSLHTHKNDYVFANQEEKQQGLVPKQNLTKHLLENEASRPKTPEHGHIARLETETPVQNDTHKAINESNVQTGMLPNQILKHTETEHRPFEIVKVKDNEKPIQFNHSHLLRYLISSVGLNKTFVMPGEKGRYKIVHEGDEDDAINSALIHWLKYQKKHIPSINIHKKNIFNGEGHFKDELKPLHHTERSHKKHTTNAQTEPDIDTHISVGISHHDVNEILPEVTSLDSITESIIHIDKELGTNTSTTEKSVVSTELKMVVDPFQATTTDNILFSTEITLTTSGNAHGTTDNESDNITSATLNPEVSTTEDINISKLLNDPSMLELLSSYGLDMNDIVYEPEVNMAISSLTDQPVTIVDRATTEENGANNHGLDITSTPEGHELSTTEAIIISKVENNPPLLELLSSNEIDMHDIVDEPEKHFAIPSLNAHGDTNQNRTTPAAIETDNDGIGVTSTTVNHEVSTTKINNISKFVNDSSLLELLSSYGLDIHDIFDEPEIQMANPSLTAQPDEATEANSDGIDIPSTNENPEVSTTKVKMLENDISLLELLNSYELKMGDIVGKLEEHIAIPSPTAPSDTIVDRTTTKATDVNNDDTIKELLETKATQETGVKKDRVDFTSAPDDNEESTTEEIDISKLSNDPSSLDVLASYGLTMHDTMNEPGIKKTNPPLTVKPDTTGDRRTTETNNKGVNVTSATENIKVSTTETIDISKLENNPSLHNFQTSFGLKMQDKVDELDVHTATPLLTAYGDIIDRQTKMQASKKKNIAKGVVSSTEEYATVIPQQDLDDIINYFTYLHTAEHLQDTDNHEVTSADGKPLVVLDEINNDKENNDKLLVSVENKTELENLLELKQDNTTDDTLSEYENLLTEPVDNHTSTIPGPYIDDDDDLKFRMDNLQREQNHHENLENVSSINLVNSQQTIQEPDQSNHLNQTWPQSRHAKDTPRSSPIIYREEIRHSGNGNNPNINVHNNLNLLKQSDNARLNAVAPDGFSHDAHRYHNKDENYESLQDTNNNVNDHYLEIILGYLNSEILTNELNALMAYSGPGQNRYQVTLQFVVGYLNKLDITHHISQEQLQFLTHKVLKHLLDYNKQYKVRKIELIYEFNHPHDLSSNVNPVYMPPKNVIGQFLSLPHNMRVQEHVPNVLPNDHLVLNSYHKQNDIDVRDHNLHNLDIYHNMGDVSDQTHQHWYNQNPDLVAFYDLTAHPHTDENSNQKHVVSVSDLHNSPSLQQLINQDLHDIAPHQNQLAQNSDNIPKGSVIIEQRNVLPDSDQKGLTPESKNESNEHNSNYDYTDSDNHIDESDLINFALGDVIHHQQSDQLAPNDNVDQNEPNLNSDPHLFHTEHSNFAPETDHNHENYNIAPNHNADLNEKELDLKHHNFNNDHPDFDHFNLLPEHNGYHQPIDYLDPNHNVKQNEPKLNSDEHNPDHHLFDSDYSNLSSGHQQQNYHLVSNQIADLNEHELDLGHSNSNNNHDADSDNFVLNLDSDHHLNNHHVDSEHLSLVPDHHGHHQQNNHLAPNYNVDNNEYALGLDYQNTNDHLVDPDHSNLAPGQDHTHKNYHLAPNQNAYLNKHDLDLDQNNSNNNHYVASNNLVPNIDSDHHHPDSHDVDSDHQNTNDHLVDPDHSNLAPGQDHTHKNYHLAPNQNAYLNKHDLDLDQNNSNNNHYVASNNLVPNIDSDHHHPDSHDVDSDHQNTDDHLAESDHSNSALGQDGYHKQNYNLDPKHNIDLTKHHFNSGQHNPDHHLIDSDHSNFAPGQEHHKNNHLLPNRNGGFNVLKIDLDHHHSNNHDVHSDHLDVVPENHGHHQQNYNLTPNPNGDNNEHTLGLYHQNINDYLTDPDHSNVALGHNSYHKQNYHLATNHNPVLIAYNLNFDNHNPYQHLVDSDHLNSVPGHHQQNYDVAKNHRYYSNQPNLGSNQYHSNTYWVAQPEQDFVSYPNVYSSPYQQIWPLKTKQSNFVYEPRFPTLDHQQNEHLFPPPPRHQIEPLSYKENGNLPHQVGADQLSLHYTFPNQQFNYLESSIYPQPDNIGQWTGSDYLNQPNPYPPYSYQQNEWYSQYQALSPEQSNWAFYGLGYPNIDLSSQSYQPYELSYSDQNIYVDQRINLPITNQHNGYEALGILDGTHLKEYLTDGIDLPNHGVVSGLDTKVHSLVSYLLDHGVSESIVLEFVDDVKKQLAEEFLERLRECQNTAYSILVQSISDLAQVYLQKHR